MYNSRFTAIPRPHPAEGIGRALQIAYRDGNDLSRELRSCLDRLERVSL